MPMRVMQERWTRAARVRRHQPAATRKLHISPAPASLTRGEADRRAAAEHERQRPRRADLRPRDPVAARRRRRRGWAAARAAPRRRRGAGCCSGGGACAPRHPAPPHRGAPPARRRRQPPAAPRRGSARGGGGSACERGSRPIPAHAGSASAAAAEGGRWPEGRAAVLAPRSAPTPLTGAQTHNILQAGRFPAPPDPR